jgi:hypothetical protein
MGMCLDWANWGALDPGQMEVLAVGSKVFLGPVLQGWGTLALGRTGIPVEEQMDIVGDK